MAEVHVFGQLIGATGFADHNLSCKWTLHCSSNWKVVEGLVEGQTQLDNPQTEDITYWCHPIDIHLLVTGIQGWPKIEFEVWKQDFYGRNTLTSYGFVHVPCEPGFHRLECFTWKPVGNYVDQVYSLFTGGSLRLQNSDIVRDGSDRFRLQTEASGKLIVELYVVMRNFERFGVETGSK